MGEVSRYDELRRARTAAAIRHATATGRLVRLRRGTYAEPVAGWRERAAAVQLAVPRSVVSHLTAAAVLGLYDPGPLTEVTVPATLGLPDSVGVRVHRARRMPPAVESDGLRTTGLVRTVLDVARDRPWPLGVVVADAALAAGGCDRDELARGLAHHRGLHGVGRARLAVDACRVGAQSPAETRLRLLLVGAGLPEPVLQHPVETSRGRLHLDLAWPAERIGIEYDGRRWHEGRDAFDRDRLRWRAFAAAGWDLHPVTALDLRVPSLLAADLRRALHRR